MYLWLVCRWVEHSHREPLNPWPAWRKSNSQLSNLLSGNLSYLPASQRWMDWHMRIIQRNVLESIGASVLPLRVYVVGKTKREKAKKIIKHIHTHDWFVLTLLSHLKSRCFMCEIRRKAFITSVKSVAYIITHCDRFIVDTNHIQVVREPPPIFGRFASTTHIFHRTYRPNKAAVFQYLLWLEAAWKDTCDSQGKYISG